jgi:hypothetical protein
VHKVEEIKKKKKIDNITRRPACFIFEFKQTKTTSSHFSTKMADHGFDSDEDRVTFDDDVQTVNSATKSMSSSKRGKKTHFDVPKQKSLFQYKRFRGNVS